MRRSLVCCSLLLVLGCSSSPAKDPASPSSASAKPAGAGAADTAAPRTTSLRRTHVKATIAQGLGMFLQNVAVDDWPVMRDGRFYGFRLRSINPAWGVDLRPGDVVTRVNGMPIEHPEEADAALRSLEKATALRVDYERDGKARTLELPIID